VYELLLLIIFWLVVVPGVPVIIEVIVTGSRTANLSWQEGVTPNPLNPPILNFAIYLNGSLMINTMNTSIILNTLTPFTDYKVTVAARNRIGLSNMSNPVLFMTAEEGTCYIPLTKMHKIKVSCKYLID